MRVRRGRPTSGRRPPLDSDEAMLGLEALVAWYSITCEVCASSVSMFTVAHGRQGSQFGLLIVPMAD